MVLYYLPIPARAWSRVQNPCSYPSSSTNNLVYLPLTDKTVTTEEAHYQTELLYKGNILQYKANSSSLTKNQKYSQICKGFGPNRKKVFATQSDKYTNPNTNSLIRTNYSNIPFPNNLVGEPNNISGPFQYDVPNPFGCSTNTIKVGGNLICGSYENSCTGEIIRTAGTSQNCYSTSYSGVPGKPIQLCWNERIQTWYPKPRYTMNNSTDKWPQNYKLFVSAVTPRPPTLFLVSLTNNVVSLKWETLVNNCLPISNFNIYQNNKLIKTVSYQTTTFSENINPKTFYSFYVTSLSKKIESNPSNTINVL